MIIIIIIIIIKHFSVSYSEVTTKLNSSQLQKSRNATKLIQVSYFTFTYFPLVLKDFFNLVRFPKKAIANDHLHRSLRWSSFKTFKFHIFLSNRINENTSALKE